MLKKKISKRKVSLSIPISNLLGLLFSSGIGIITIVLLSLFVSYIFSKSANFPSYTGVYFCGCVGLGSIIGGFISAKKCNFKGFISGFICSFITLLFITVLMLFFTDGKLNEKTLILFLIIIICSTVGGIISANTKKR